MQQNEFSPLAMTQAQFDALAAAGYNRIPIAREMAADLDTPLTVWMKLADGAGSYLLESAESAERVGRYSIIGLPAERAFRVRGDVLSETVHGEVVAQETVADPLNAIRVRCQRYRVPRSAALPPFSGGLVGYFGFETLVYIEPKLRNKTPPDEIGLDDVVLLESIELAVFDNVKGRLFLIVHADPALPQALPAAQRRLDSLTHRLRQTAVTYPETLDPQLLDESSFKSGFTEAGFIAAVEKIKEYILAGDAFQVVPSQRMSVPFRARPLDVYRALRQLNPSPYMYLLDVGDAQIVGSSPEILVRLHDNEVTVRPLAGTLPRGDTAEADQRNAEALINDPKERAEHLMLIDLGRNDVGRVAVPGTVRVPDQMVIERYSHVMHIVSQVVGELQPGLDFFDVLRATFPAGTLSGAPKIRAVEIIAELEPVKRGVYGGAVGTINWWSEADLAIAIRTAVIAGGQLHVQAGAGIVADSDPQREWEETLAKGRALFRAVAQAVRGM